jgi:Domain of unknown function (DUF4440)
MAGNGQTVIDLDRKRMQAMAAKDMATLEALLADEPSDVKAQDFGDTVVLTGVAQIKVMVNGTPNAFGVRFTDVYAKRNGRWQMVTWQSTRLPA